MVRSLIHAYAIVAVIVCVSLYTIVYMYLLCHSSLMELHLIVYLLTYSNFNFITTSTGPVGSTNRAEDQFILIYIIHAAPEAESLPARSE